jgi:hypothetical protein
VTTLLYAFSGAWHAFAKIPEKPKPASYKVTTEFTPDKLTLNISSLLPTIKKEEKLVNISAVKIEDKAYWQLFVFDGKKLVRKYVDQNNLVELKDGDIQYGRYLASLFSKQNGIEIKNAKQLTSYNNQYSMMNRRLPVVEVDFKQSPDYFVETSTGKLAAVVKVSAQAERFSFSNLHMHHYWEKWFGKGAGGSLKNIVLIASTLGLLIVALTGMVIYIRKRFHHNSI